MFPECSFGGILKFCFTVISGGCKNWYILEWHNTWTKLIVKIRPTAHSGDILCRQLVKISEKKIFIIVFGQHLCRVWDFWNGTQKSKLSKYSTYWHVGSCTAGHLCISTSFKLCWLDRTWTVISRRSHTIRKIIKRRGVRRGRDIRRIRSNRGRLRRGWDIKCKSVGRWSEWRRRRESWIRECEYWHIRRRARLRSRGSGFRHLKSARRPRLLLWLRLVHLRIGCRRSWGRHYRWLSRCRWCSAKRRRWGARWRRSSARRRWRCSAGLLRRLRGRRAGTKYWTRNRP